MKTISCWDHLEPFGIKALTGEACALMFRLLCDITEPGKRIIEKCIGCELRPPPNWNAGATGSVMLTHEMLVPLAVFALLEDGCRECWVIGPAVFGIEADDSPADVEHLVSMYAEHRPRRLAYRDGADRNVHQMSGRQI